VDFVDWVNRDQLLNYYRKASLFFFPSHEGAGMVVSEAMSCGLPVICFDNCGPGEFVDDQSGIKVPYGSYHHCIRLFSRALLRLHKNRQLLESLSAGAVNRFNTHFSWSVKGEQLQAIYQSTEIKMETPKKINKVVCVHLLNDYSGSPLVFSGAIKGLVNSGHAVDLYTSGNSKGFLSGLPVKNFTFWYKFYPGKYARLSAFFLSQTILFFRLLKYFRQPVDIYVNTLLPFGAALAGKVMGKKVIYHLHETSINPPSFKKFLQMVAESTANTAIYVSNFLMRSDPLRGVASSVVHNALPDEFVSRATSYRLHKLPEENIFNVLMICSLKSYKGVPEFVNLATKMPHIRFELVLNASTGSIEKFFNGSELPPNLFLHPATDNVHPFYEKANLVLNLSRPDQWVETFGMTILEAMCYGIPVIAPPVGGVTELVQPNINGFLKDVRSSHDMQNTIHQIYANPLLCKRLSQQAVLTAEKFSLTTMQQKVCEIIEKPVGK
jgi:glycosyltransferase involved in cell wall biosynthesis